MKIAVCSGSFDPITLGHLDVIRRAAACFDEVWVCVSPNAEKKSQMFTGEQKLRLVETAVASLPNVHAELYDGLLADFVRKHRAAVIVRGIRSAVDFSTEYQMAQISHDLCPEAETVLLPARAEYQHFSSTMVREMIRYRQPLEKYMPASIVSMVLEMAEKRKGEP